MVSDSYRSSCRGLDLHPKSQGLRPTHQAARRADFVQRVEVATTEVAVGSAVREDVVGGDEDLVADREGGALAASSRLEAVVLVPEVAALLPHGRDRGFDQGSERTCTLPLRAVPRIGLPALS